MDKDYINRLRKKISSSRAKRLDYYTLGTKFAESEDRLRELDRHLWHLLLSAVSTNQKIAVMRELRRNCECLWRLMRVSTDKQAEEGTSLETKIEKCRAYAEGQGYHLVKIFREEGESAKAWQKPVLLSLLQCLHEHKGKISVLIVYKLDRLSRNSDDQHVIRYKLSQAEVTLQSATENIEDTAVGRFMRTVLWGVAQFDNEVRAERTRSGLYARFKAGYWPFQPPRGTSLARTRQQVVHYKRLIPTTEKWSSGQPSAGLLV